MSGNAPGLKVVPTDAALGAIVTGLDLTHVDDATFATIHQAWLDNLVLVVKHQKLTDDQLMAFGQRFGQLDEVPPVSVGQKPRDNKYISVVSNILENGVPIGGLGDLEVFWHSDTSYRERPPSASILHCLQVPDWGGDTGFSNMYLALESFDPGMRKRVETLQVKNDTTYTAGGQLRAGYKPITDLRTSPGATHPMVRTHPETGLDALNLGRRLNSYVPGMEVADSEILLNQLWAHATLPHFSWVHKWEVGDIVIWDNRCTMHRRDNFDPHSHRVMHRAQAQEPTRPYFTPSDAPRPPHPRGKGWAAAAQRLAS